MEMLIGTAAAFASVDPLLPPGQFGYESDTGVLKIGDGSSVWSALNQELLMGSSYSLRYDQDADPPTTAYLGHALPGTSTASATWRIQKLTFGGDGDVTSTWADGNSLFDNVWDNRASLSYS